MDKIFLNEMEFYGYHGALPEENRLGQRFIVDLMVELDLSKAGKTDDLSETVNYADLYSLCKEIVEGKSYSLIETVAEQIANNILTHFEKINSCTVKLIKPDPPIPGHYKSVSIEITRKR
ncbi:dihydroneopterin aldolase [Pallidibacillus pasinlerensis]|uniref:7,8-dihydroneopterin aldolase n=1 Tax=Pallidibacillus pasinlerensis TaxID=2703818 RepID=A0ABX0A8E0_9BACI|nr:dihydroneopterin aldolase [Pallidibacillus pasinlerensis]NCU17725.1 dihydroneopterin aldolase [Pallidibacillus pasinlerensis]